MSPRPSVKVDERGYIESTTSCARQCGESGHSVTATARVHSRTPPTTTMRSLPLTCSIRFAPRERSHPRRLGRVRMNEDEVRRSGRLALIGKGPITRVGRAVEKVESRVFMKVLVYSATKQTLGAAILGTGGRRGHSLDS